MAVYFVDIEGDDTHVGKHLEEIFKWTICVPGYLCINLLGMLRCVTKSFLDQVWSNDGVVFSNCPSIAAIRPTQPGNFPDGESTVDKICFASSLHLMESNVGKLFCLVLSCQHRAYSSSHCTRGMPPEIVMITRSSFESRGISRNVMYGRVPSERGIAATIVYEIDGVPDNNQPSAQAHSRELFQPFSLGFESAGEGRFLQGSQAKIGPRLRFGELAFG